MGQKYLPKYTRKQITLFQMSPLNYQINFEILKQALHPTSIIPMSLLIVRTAVILKLLSYT